MITKPLFRRHYFIFVSIIIVFIFIAFASSFIINSIEREQMDKIMSQGPANLIRKMLVILDKDPIVAARKLKTATTNDPFLNFDLVDSQGMSLIDSGRRIIAPLSSQQLGELSTNDTITLKRSKYFGPPPAVVGKTQSAGVYFVIMHHPPGPPPPMDSGNAPGLRPPLPPPPGHGGGPGPGMIGGRPPGAPGGGPFGPMQITMVALVICTLISVGIALLFQFSKYRERASEAMNVLSELKHGNLSARMPQKRFDELGPLVQAFNVMASDLERTVENLRKADHSRRQLLQDLAHDLRTPLTSLKTFLETLKNSQHRLSDEKRHEVISLCFSEVEYFAKLVEDLLFLAQISEPKYSPGTENINLKDKIQEQMSVFKTRYPQIDFKLETQASDLRIVGSPKLIDRLLRNAFENSSSFAKSEVRIELGQIKDELYIHITDDGPGLSPEAIKEFGYKKSSRVVSIDSPENTRISVGIGSVIMREIAQLHSGRLVASNVSNQDKVLGAKISVFIPKV